MTSVYLPPKDKFPANSCSTPCKDPFIPRPLCVEQCDQYTYGPFTAPATIYTYYNYPSIDNGDFTVGCRDNCSNKHITTELNYSIYQIIEGVEHFVGTWLIKDKSGPNKREFKECGEYILRFCSEPPNECYPECVHPEPPTFEISKSDCCNCCLGGYIDSATGESNPDFELFYEFLINTPKCCEIIVTVVFESGDVNTFTLPSQSTMYQFDSGKFCEAIESISFEGLEECIEKLHVIVKR